MTSSFSAATTRAELPPPGRNLPFGMGISAFGHRVLREMGNGVNFEMGSDFVISLFSVQPSTGSFFNQLKVPRNTNSCFHATAADYP